MSDSLKMVSAFALVLQFGLLAGFAQTNIYFFTGSETNISLPRGTYDITAYGAQGGGGGFGVELEGQFRFPETTTLTLLVGGGGLEAPPYSYYRLVGGGGGGSFVINGTTPLVIAGGGGGCGFAYVGDNGSAGINGGGGTDFNAGGGGSDGDGGNGGGIYYYEPSGGGGGGGGYYSGGGGGYAGGEGGSSYLNGGDGGNGLGGGAGGFGGGGGGGSGGGGGGGYSGGGGGGGGGLGGGGGGGGSFIDSSALTNVTEVSGIGSPDDSPNGEIIIVKVLLHITTISLPTGTNGVAYYQELGATGGTPPYYWSLSRGWLPWGLELSRRGVIRGTPILSGTFRFQVKVRDSSDDSVIQQFTLIVKKNRSPIPPHEFH
jgi:hypothetical protein